MIYWDNNATSPIAPQVREAMLPYLGEFFFNPSAAYAPAKAVRRAVEEARERIAAFFGAEADELVFTSGGTEASNAALAGFHHALTLATEHPATLRTLTGQDRQCSVCPVLSNGVADLLAWKELLQQGCDGASFAWANHETGVIQPVRSLCAAADAVGAVIHVDIVQAAAKLPIRLHEHPISFASISAHKFHGPKGIGALYVRRGTAWNPYLTGGGQESGRRSGTENVAGIIGFAKAVELAQAEQETYARLSTMRDRFLAALQEAGITVEVNGGTAPRLPHVLNMRLPGVSAESLTLLLEPAGLICSAGSACTSSDPHPSHVLLAMGLPEKAVRESLRFSLNRFCTEQEVDEAAAIFVSAYRKIRSVQSTITGPVMVYR